jgi:hypothetical protein
MTALASVLFCYLLLAYRKLGATWAGVPVLVFAAAAVPLTIVIMAGSTWFRVRRVRTPARAFLIPLAGIVIATGLGIYRTEPLEPGGSTAYQRSAAGGERTSSADSYWATRGFFHILDLDLGAMMSSALLIVAVVLILGATAIPHFWVFAGFVFLTCMGMIALRELRVRPEPPPPPIREEPADESP